MILPTILEFEAKGIYLFVDAPVIFNREEITDMTTVDSVVTMLTNGETVPSIGEINEIYSLRFISDKYSHMYFCFDYITTDDGSYFYDHLSLSYVKANGILDGYVASLEGKIGE